MLKVTHSAYMLYLYVDLDPVDWIVQNASNSKSGRFLNQSAQANGIHTIIIVFRSDLNNSLKKVLGLT